FRNRAVGHDLFHRPGTGQWNIRVHFLQEFAQRANDCQRISAGANSEAHGWPGLLSMSPIEGAAEAGVFTKTALFYVTHHTDDLPRRIFGPINDNHLS